MSSTKAAPAQAEGGGKGVLCGGAGDEQRLNEGAHARGAEGHQLLVVAVEVHQRACMTA